MTNDSSQGNDRQIGRSDLFGPERKPFAPETKVFSRLDGEPGTILNRVGPGAYEVMTDQGIEVWELGDIQVVED